MRHIAYITGTRADYGLMREVLFSIRDSKDLKLTIIATGMHLMKEFGESIKLIREDGFDIQIVDARYDNDSRNSMAFFFGNFSLGLARTLERIKPDIVLVLGDRAEMLSAASVATYLGIPSAHIHGGEVTSTVDESARHAITKLANIHFPATEDAARRIGKLGERKENIFVVGAPGLDNITENTLKKEDLEKRLGIKFSDKTAIVLQHPVSSESESSREHMKETIDAIKELDIQTVIIYPNADCGGREMIKEIESIDHREFSKIKAFRNLKHNEFLSLMKYSSVLVGNSSAGMIESSSFRIPVVNIGTRQSGRLRGKNVIDTGYDRKEIMKAIKKSLTDKKYLEKIKASKNPYGDGRCSEKITRILSEITLDDKLLQKRITY